MRHVKVPRPRNALAFLGAVVVVVASILVLVAKASPGAFASASMLLSACALMAVAASLYYQQQQTHISRIQAISTQRSELLRYGLENPFLLSVWGRDTTDPRKAQIQSYASMVFAYYAHAFQLRQLTESELRLTCSRAFRDSQIAEWWRQASHVFHMHFHGLAPSFSRADFATIVDNVHEQSVDVVMPR